MNSSIHSHSGGYHLLYTTMTYNWSCCCKPVNCYKKGQAWSFTLHTTLFWLSAFHAMYFTIYTISIYISIRGINSIQDIWHIMNHTHAHLQVLQVLQVVWIPTKFSYVLYLIIFGVKLGFGSVRLLSPNENARVHFWTPNTSVRCHSSRKKPLGSVMQHAALNSMRLVHCWHFP